MNLSEAQLDALADAVMLRLVRRLGLMAQTPPRRLDRGQLQQALGGVSRETIRQLVAEGLPGEGVGDEARYDLDEVKTWLAEREKRADDAPPRRASARR